jgi:hypothetical protein
MRPGGEIENDAMMAGEVRTTMASATPSVAAHRVSIRHGSIAAPSPASTI